MREQTTELKAREYVYDLGNCAKENGFKADERWELSLTTAEEKTSIEKRYFPTVAIRVMPEVLGELFRLVKVKLADIKYGLTKTREHESIAGEELQYLIAFNPNRPRR
jgi:hypothetical protein